MNCQDAVSAVESVVKFCKEFAGGNTCADCPFCIETPDSKRETWHCGIGHPFNWEITNELLQKL